MQVKISVRHGHLGEAAQRIIREKAEKLLNLFDRITLIEVTVDMKKTEADKCTVEILVQAEHKHEGLVAQEKPPKASNDTPTAACAKTTTAAREIRPLDAAEASDQNTTTFAASTISRLQTTGFSRSRVASYWSACRGRSARRSTASGVGSK